MRTYAIITRTYAITSRTYAIITRTYAIITQKSSCPECPLWVFVLARSCTRVAKAHFDDVYARIHDVAPAVDVRVLRKRVT